MAKKRAPKEQIYRQGMADPRTGPERIAERPEVQSKAASNREGGKLQPRAGKAKGGRK